FSLVDPGSGRRDDDRGDRLGPALVRQADHHGFRNVLVGGGNGLLDLDRGDVLPTGLDDVLASVGEPQDAVGVEVTDVAGVEPAVLERRVCRFLVVQVAG